MADLKREKERQQRSQPISKFAIENYQVGMKHFAKNKLKPTVI